MGKIRANKRTLIRWKVYIDRARMYIGYAQFLMILFVLLEAYKESTVGGWIFDNMLLSMPILFILFILFSLILGRIDSVLGLREEELRNASTSNPVMRELLSKVDQLTEEVKALKDQQKKNS